MTPEAQVAGVTETMQTEALPSARQTQATQVQSPVSPPVQDGGVTLSGVFGLFNVVVGLMLVAAFLLFFGGLTGYLSRLGLENRIEGLTFMYRGVTVLFVLIILLAIVHFIQFHSAFVLTVVAIVVIAFGAYAAVRSAQASGAGDEEAH